MLTVIIPEGESFDKVKDEFVTLDSVTLTLSHTLVSISKWESKWLKPFLSELQRTDEETLDYIQCMSSSHINPETMARLGNVELGIIRDYIQAPMTATVINDKGKGGKAEVITSEIIYYWMVALNIPWECQHWHLNRLMMLVNVCNIKNTPSKKMSKKETMSSNASLNAARKKAMNTPG